MSDLISRQKVENRLKEDIKKCKEALENGTHPLHNEDLKWAIHFDKLYLKCLKNVPTVEERKHGHWNKVSPAGIYECSNCGDDVMTADIECYKYCHHCGAIMDEREEQDNDSN